MKRLAWLLLLVCTAAFARVQPIELPVEPDSCCCCETSGACGMPDCAPPPAQIMVALDRPATAQRAETRRKTAQPVHIATRKFYAPFLTATPPESVSFAKDMPVTPPAPPLRVTQCQWLI
ncbi:MAG: hypothetical protein IT582_04990 [Opitutaceae bacterium]|nr:hypothetical protein [Opitutaceae bacterium]